MQRLRSRVGPHGRQPTRPDGGVCALALLVFLILAAPAAFASPPNLVTFSKTGEWLIKTWEIDDGLPENSATAMAQTPDGFLWFGTFKGLVRFDGVKFTVYDQFNTPELPGSAVVNLHLDQQQRLWISTENGIVYRHGREWSKVFDGSQGWTGSFVRTFAEGAGRLFVTSFDGKIFEFNGERFNELPTPPGAPGRAYFGSVDERGVLWVAQHGFVGHWDGSSWREAGIEHDLLNKAGGAGAARDGGLWLFNGRQLSRFIGGQIVNSVSLHSRMAGGFWSLTEDQQRNVWIATYDAGVFRVAPDGSVEHITTAQGLSYDAVRFVVDDDEGNYWIGTSGGGLMRLRRRAFFSFDESAGLPRRVVRSIAVTRSNEVLVGIYGGGVVRFSDRGITPVELPAPLENSAYVQSVLEDSAGRIWVGTFEKGLALLDGPNGRVISRKESGGNSIRALFEDSRRRIWIASDEAVSVFDGEQFHVHKNAAGHPLDRVNCFAEDPVSGTVWLGDSHSRLHRFQDDAFREVPAVQGAISAPVKALLAEKDGTLWVGADGAGLGRFREGKFVRIHSDHGLPARRIGSILSDAMESLWLGTDRGIVRVNRSELTAVANGTQRKLTLQVFDHKDYGLLTTECATTGQPGCARDGAGQLWFATQRGISALDPRRLPLSSETPPVRIGEVWLTDRHARTRSLEWAGNAPLAIPPGSRTVEIHFTALSYTAPNQVTFSTRLTRNGKELVSMETDRRFAVFDWLPPGNYHFHVAAANHNGVWNRDGATVRFTVLPHFWQTTWFRLLIAFVLVAGTAAVVWRALHNRHQRAVEKLEERKRAEKLLVQEHARRLNAEREARSLSQRLLTAHEDERSRLARELHDDVTQRLARLAIDAAQAERGVLTTSSGNSTWRTMREELVRLSEDVHTLAYRLHPSMLEDLGLVEALRAECDRFSRQHSIPVEVRQRDVPRDLPPELAVCLFRIVQESLRNVARHARATAVELSLARMDGGLQLSVRDNGIGFRTGQNQKRPSLGHAGMKERVSLVQGELAIESEPGHGTTVMAWVPLKEILKS